MAQKILIADDDQIVHESLGIYLKAEGFETVDVFDGEAALQNLSPDVVLCVLDIMMPKMTGIEVCREIRKSSQLPILMLTAKGEEIDRIVGLELGADDYIVKPFSPREVVARIKAVLRRTSEQRDHLQRAHDRSEELYGNASRRARDLHAEGDRDPAHAGSESRTGLYKRAAAFQSVGLRFCGRDAHGRYAYQTHPRKA